MVQADHIWDKPLRVSPDWDGLTETGRLERAAAALRAFPQGDRVRVESAAVGGEVTLSVLGEFTPAEEGHLLMEAEACLRSALREPVQVYLHERHDENKPRQNRDVILAWIKAREDLREQGTRG